MGVRGLQSFFENDCSEACKYVSIEQLANDHRRIFNCQPVVVVDGMSLLNRLYNNTSLEWIYGGQWLQFYEELQRFIARFRSIGVHLVFFFDGTVCASKREEWVNRRLQKYDMIASIFNVIKVTKTEPNKKLFQLPTSMGLLSRFAVKELGAEVYQTDRDADEVIAEYAFKNREVFAIMSQDSDFIIYNTKPYLSLSHLDLNTLRTIHYDRYHFAVCYLNLQIQQLPLFACLMGNDYVPFDKLRRFHQSLSKNGRVYFAAIAGNLSKVIKMEHWTGDLNNWQELNHISLKAFGHSNFSHLIRDGLKSYMLGVSPSSTICVNVVPEMERAVYQRHLNCSNAPYIFNLLCNMEYESSVVLEDASRLPTALAYREIRQRCYGVLFNCFLKPTYPTGEMHSENGNSIIIKEWCAYKGNLMKHPESIKPLALDLCPVAEYEGWIPRVEDLWFKCSETQKLRVFWHILNIPMDFDLLSKLPKEYVVLACVLNYLIGGMKSGPLLQPLEVAVFVVQALWKITSEELKRLVAPSVDEVAVNLSTLFMRGVTTVVMVLSVCGTPFPLMHAMPWRFFDGKLFHHLYNSAKQRPNIHELCRNQESIIRDFYTLLQSVTSNTVYNFRSLDWRTIFPDFEYSLQI